MIISNSQTKLYLNPNKQISFSTKIIKAVGSKRVIKTKTLQKSLINYALNSNFLIFPFVISTIGDFISLFFNAKANLKNNEAQAFPLFCQELSNKISNPIIDELYNLGIKSGSTGGKLLGAGGGGFILFYVPSANHERFKIGMSNFAILDFKFDDKGTEIVYRD